MRLRQTDVGHCETVHQRIWISIGNDEVAAGWMCLIANAFETCTQDLSVS
jgi:hypothetical protein